MSQEKMGCIVRDAFFVWDYFEELLELWKSLPLVRTVRGVLKLQFAILAFAVQRSVCLSFQRRGLLFIAVIVQQIALILELESSAIEFLEFLPKTFCSLEPGQGILLNWFFIRIKDMDLLFLLRIWRRCSIIDKSLPY